LNSSEKFKSAVASKSFREKISIGRRKFLEENPEKVPYRLNHSSKESSKQFVGDFNGDGFDDIATRNSTTLEIALNDGQGEFSKPQAWLKNIEKFAGDFFVGDFNRDGKSDLLAFDPNNANWEVYDSNGQLFQNGATWLKSFGAKSLQQFVADFNGDHRDDLFIETNSTDSKHHWQLALSDGKRLIPSPLNFTPEIYNQRNIVGDLNGDGKNDLVSIDASGSWWVNYFDGTNFSTAQKIFSGLAISSQTKILSGDVDGDGRDDLAFVSPEDGEWYVGLTRKTDRKKNILIPSFCQATEEPFGYAADGFFLGNFAPTANSKVKKTIRKLSREGWIRFFPQVERRMRVYPMKFCKTPLSIQLLT
jgi:hypothetical protein